jgi:hypothetical protein
VAAPCAHVCVRGPVRKAAGASPLNSVVRHQRAHLKRITIELAVVVLSAIAFAVFLYSELFRLCCKHIEVLFFPVVLPAARFGTWLSGATSANQFYLAIGMISEFVLIWAAIRGYRYIRLRAGKSDA